MSNSNQRHSRVLWITRTAVLVALLIALQWATAGTQAFAGQYITGSLVNCVLAVAALFAGVWSGVVVALLSPFFAFILGIGPKLIQIVPCIALGNLVYVLLLYFMTRARKQTLPRKALTLLVASVTKFAVLNIAVVRIVIPLMGDMLKAPQIQTFSVMFSTPQLATALIGGTLAMMLVPVLRKAIKE